MCRTFFVLVLPLTSAFAQQDNPVPRDLGDLVILGRTQTAGELKVLEGVRKQLPPAGNDPGKLAVKTHADMLICLATGDHFHKEAGLYEQAVVSAGQIAGAWERKAAKPIPSPDDAFSGPLREIQSRIDQLQRKSDPTDDDRAELQSMERRAKALGEAIAVLERVRAAAEDPAKYVAAARQMRGRERVFQLLAEEARLQETISRIACQSGVLTLQALDKRQKIDDQLHDWEAVPDRVFDGVTPPRPESRAAAETAVEPQRTKFDRIHGSGDPSPRTPAATIGQ